ncbi:branched-chain amino acid aminotransferase [Roseivirga sp. BDSF3-8]|uniref:branched-chain amino acid aminotransferase n=1 Tax=Roseivirga sp. BDSF3-8 TaxID=3241598 RepID=UPI00353251E0
MTETVQIDIQRCQNSRIEQVDFNDIKFGQVYSDHMFMADYVDGHWTNLKIIPYQNLSLSPATSAIHYGQSVFEGMKAYKNTKGEIAIFRPEDNASRLNASANRMCIPELPEEIFMSGLIELLKLDSSWIPNKRGTSLYIRPFIFATDEYIGIRPSSTYKFMIFTCPVGSYYSGAVKVKIETKYARAVRGGTGYAKAAGNYAGSLYPARQAQNDGFNQLIWTDALTHEYIEESGTMNVMFIIGDSLLTAPTGDTILKGITRNSVLTLAREYGLKVEERPVKVTEVLYAIKNGTLKEAFGTGTAATIAHISHIGHEDDIYTLPEVEGRKFSPWVLDRLDSIKYGDAEDTYNWVHIV